MTHFGGQNKVEEKLHLGCKRKAGGSQMYAWMHRICMVVPALRQQQRELVCRPSVINSQGEQAKSLSFK